MIGFRFRRLRSSSSPRSSSHHHTTRAQLHCPICMLLSDDLIITRYPTEQYIILSYLALSYPFSIFSPILSLDKYASLRFLIFFRRQGPDRFQRLLPFAVYSFFTYRSPHNRRWLQPEESHPWADTTSVAPVAAKLLVRLFVRQLVMII